MKTVRIGVIGTGLAWERLHYPAIQELGNKYQIVALANRTKSDAEQFAKKINLGTENVYSDYMQMLQREDIDAIDIVVPIEMNYEVSENVAKAGFNFVCEKPLAPDMEQAKKYLDLSKKYGVRIMIAENFRYNACIKCTKNYISFIHILFLYNEAQDVPHFYRWRVPIQLFRRWAYLPPR